MKLFLFIILLLPITNYASEVKDPQINNQSLTSDNNFNFKVNALGLAFGLGDLSLEYKVKPNLTISGSILFGKFNQESPDGIYKFDISTFGGNVKGTYYFNEAFRDSFYIATAAGILDFKVQLKSDTIPASSEFSSAYIGATVGYIWHWSHLNVGVGAGYNHSFEDKDAEIRIDNIVGTTTVQVQYNLILEASLGITF